MGGAKVSNHKPVIDLLQSYSSIAEGTGGTTPLNLLSIAEGTRGTTPQS